MHSKKLQVLEPFSVTKHPSAVCYEAHLIHPLGFQPEQFPYGMHQGVGKS